MSEGASVVCAPGLYAAFVVCSLNFGTASEKQMCRDKEVNRFVCGKQKDETV